MKLSRPILIHHLAPMFLLGVWSLQGAYLVPVSRLLLASSPLLLYAVVLPLLLLIFYLYAFEVTDQTIFYRRLGFGCLTLIVNFLPYSFPIWQWAAIGINVISLILMINLLSGRELWQTYTQHFSLQGVYDLSVVICPLLWQ